MIALYLATGFEELEAITIYTVLKRGGVDVKLISITEKLEVMGARGATLIANQNINEINYQECEMIILPGGALGANNLLDNLIVQERLIEFNKKGKWIGAICAAPYVLGELGILNGKEATSYPGFESHLKGATLSENKVVISENIVTSRGPGTALEFAFEILNILKGKVETDKIKEQMLLK
jgi:4-methyl-5(b-hydroxyethyl)-thiazole monophosphate biosynthesis